MKTATLFLHGALGAASQFDPIMPLLSDRNNTYPLSFPGHGPNTPSEPFSLDLFAGSVLRFMDENDIEAAHFFGYSMGGYSALYLAAKYPARVLSVRTLGTKLAWSPEVAAGMNRMFDPEKIEAKVPHFAAALADTHVDWKALCHYTADFLNDLGNGLGIDRTAFAAIRCPVVIGRGSEDNVVTEEESRETAALIPGGKFVELPGVKHAIELTSPEILVKFVEG